MVEQTDKERFLLNYRWFNHFFEQLHALFEIIQEEIEIEVEVSNALRYHPKKRVRPTLPPYDMLGLETPTHAIQVYALLDPQYLDAGYGMIAEPSFFVIKHSRAERYGWSKDYGWGLLRGRIGRVEQQKAGIVSAVADSGESKGTQFYAFQVPLDSFVEGATANVRQVIRREIVEPLQALPDFAQRPEIS